MESYIVRNNTNVHTQAQVNQVQVGDNYCTVPLKCASVLPSKIAMCVTPQGCTVQGLNSRS